MWVYHFVFLFIFKRLNAVHISRGSNEYVVPIGTFIGELDGGGISYLRRFPMPIFLPQHKSQCRICRMHPVVITCIVIFMSVLDILLVLREVEETSLLSESERMLSKTILVPGANHAQVNIGIHATWLKRWYTVWALNKIFVSMAMVKAQVSSGSIPEDVIDNDIDPELTEEQAHQVGRWSW